MAFFVKFYLVLLQIHVIDAQIVKSGLHRIQKRISGVQYCLEHHHHGYFYALTDRPLSGDELLATRKHYVVRCPVQDVQETRWGKLYSQVIKQIYIFNFGFVSL